jgi:hypothetical protein
MMQEGLSPQDINRNETAREMRANARAPTNKTRYLERGDLSLPRMKSRSQTATPDVKHKETLNRSGFVIPAQAGIHENQGTGFQLSLE